MENMNELALIQGERSVTEVGQQVQKIQELMGAVMKKDEHYGVIPGTNRPSLLKPGAEKLCFVFRLAPEFEVAIDNFPNGHREYRITCRLRSMTSGVIVGEGVGSCSTMESKYRYRNNSDYEVLDEPIPDDSKERKSEYRKQGFGMKKVDGSWCWVKYSSTERVENPDIADVYNTVLKMAKKRAHIDATITACAASDIFTQDVEDTVDPEPEDNGNDGRPRGNHGTKSKGSVPAKNEAEPLHDTPPEKSRGKLLQEAAWYARLTDDETKAAVYTVCDPFDHPTVSGAINTVNDESFKKILAAVKTAGENKKIGNEVDKEAANA